MSEAASRETFQKHVKKAFANVHFQRFEDRFHSGIPDINFCVDGVEWWVEAKHLDALPVRASTPVRIDLRMDQVLWLKHRKKAGGLSLVLVRVGREQWVAFTEHFDRLEEGIPTETFFQLSYWHGTDLQELLSVLYGLG